MGWHMAERMLHVQVDMRAARNAENRALAQLAEARRELEEKDAQLGGLTGRAQIERMLALRRRTQELEQELEEVSMSRAATPLAVWTAHI